MAVYEEPNEDLLDAAGDELIDEATRTELMKLYDVSEFRSRMKSCTKCSLRAKCSQVVPFRGPVSRPGHKVCFCGLGEAPGKDEDRIGDPFVGNSGDKIDTTLGRFKVDVRTIPMLNVVGCRPWKWEKAPWDPDKLRQKDISPPPAEAMKACRGWLEEQIALIDPWCFLVFGATALKVLDPTLSLTLDHGKFFRVPEGRPGAGRLGFATYHPGATFGDRDAAGERDKAFTADLQHAAMVWRVWQEMKGGCEDHQRGECERCAEMMPDIPARILTDRYEILLAEANMRQATPGGFLDFGEVNFL